MNNVNISRPSPDARSECDIRVNPDDPTKLIAAVNDHHTETLALFRSSDGGATWRPSIDGLPLQDMDAKQVDPQVDWSSDAAWALAVGEEPATNTAIEPVKRLRAYRSLNGGRTWLFAGTPSGDSKAADRGLLWVDKSPTSRYRDQIYVVHTPGGGPYFARRTRDGRWEAPQLLKGVETNSAPLGCDVKTNNDGVVFVFWPDVLGNQSIFVRRSVNGGQSFEPFRLVAQTFTHDNELHIPAAEFHGARLYLSAGAYRKGAKDLVYVVWTDLDGTPGCTAPPACKTRVWFSRSTDGGSSWSSPVKVNDQPSLNDQFHSRLCVDQSNGNLVVTYYDTVADPHRLKTNVFMQKSIDEGLHWSAAVIVTSAPSDVSEVHSNTNVLLNQYGDYAGLDGQLGTFFPVWTDRRTSSAKTEMWTARVSIVEKRAFFWLDNGPSGDDLVLAEGPTPATLRRGLFFVVEGFTGAELGVTRDDLGPDPAIVPRLEVTPASGMRVGPPTHLFAQDGSDRGLTRPQRFTWKYSVSLMNDNGIAGPVRLRAFVATISSEVVIELPQPPDAHSSGWDLPPRRIPNTFEFRPTPPMLAQVARPDELVIDWGDLPAGTAARLYLPDVSADDIVEMAAKRYFAPRLARVVHPDELDEVVDFDVAPQNATPDENTLRCLVGGITYVPLPAGPEVSLLGLLTIYLPPGIESGQPFDVVVRQITYVGRGGDQPRTRAPGFESPAALSATRRDAPAAERGTASRLGIDGLLDTVEDRRDDGWWRVLATFRISIPASARSTVQKDEIALGARRLGRDRARGFGSPISPARRTLAGFGAVRTIALGTSMTQIIGPSQQRVALLFSPPTTAGQTYTVTTEPGASLGAGLNVTSTTGPLLLTEEVFGDAVKRPWFAAGSSAFSIGVLEAIVGDKP